MKKNKRISLSFSLLSHISFIFSHLFFILCDFAVSQFRIGNLSRGIIHDLCERNNRGKNNLNSARAEGVMGLVGPIGGDGGLRPDFDLVSCLTL